MSYSEDELKKESQSFETLKPSSEMVGLEHAFNLASGEEWSPSED